MTDLESDLVVPMEEDENVGDGVPRKRVKRKKTKEERIKERRVVFWTLIVVIGITIFFWWWPKIRNLSLGVPAFKMERKNYVEYKL